MSLLTQTVSDRDFCVIKKTHVTHASDAWGLGSDALEALPLHELAFSSPFVPARNSLMYGHNSISNPNHEERCIMIRISLTRAGWYKVLITTTLSLIHI